MTAADQRTVCGLSLPVAIFAKSSSLIVTVQSALSEMNAYEFNTAKYEKDVIVLL